MPIAMTKDQCECDELCCTVGWVSKGTLKCHPPVHGAGACEEAPAVLLLINFKHVEVCKGCDQRITDRELRRFLGTD